MKLNAIGAVNVRLLVLKQWQFEVSKKQNVLSILIPDGLSTRVTESDDHSFHKNFAPPVLRKRLLLRERQLLHNNRVTFYRNVFQKKVSECVCAQSASMVNGRLRIYLLSSVFVFVDDFTDYIYDKDFS